MVRRTGDFERLACSCLFDLDWYLDQNPDVRLAGVHPLAHYLLHGAAEGRDPSAYFSSTYYLDRNPEARLAGTNPLVHFLGRRDFTNVDATPHFDCEYYLTIYRDIAAAKINPLEHYVQYGENEGRSPNAGFSPEYYRAKHLHSEDLAGASPLRHYIESGHKIGLETSENPTVRYLKLTAAQEQQYALELIDIYRHVDWFDGVPHFLIYLLCETTAEAAGLSRQLYPHWTICRCLEDVLSNESRLGGTPWFMIWLNEGDVCHPLYLYMMACAFAKDPSVDFVYADEDHLSSDGGRVKPFYKPAWSPDYLESCNYIGPTACVAGRIAARNLLDVLGQYDFVLRTSAEAATIRHVDRVLMHRVRPMNSPRHAQEQEQDVAALDRHIARTGRTRTVRAVAEGLACYEVMPTVDAGPLSVSVIIPTAGKDAEIGGRRVNLVINIVNHIRGNPRYSHIEIITVINPDMPPDTRSSLRDMGAKIIVYDESAINIAKKINLGAKHAHGEYLVLLNDDIEPISANWIERMRAEFDKPHVGVVGAKLLYADQRTQHVGVVINSGKPEHPRVRYAREDHGYFFSTIGSRNFMAVTGAAMMTPRTVFEKAGQYSEQFAFDYNDIDYCLKVRELGLLSVYCAAIELTHHESISRGSAVDERELDYFYRKWAAVSEDPYYNQRFLTVSPPTFEPSYNGRPTG